MPKVSSSIKAAILLGQGQGTVHIWKKFFACSLIRSFLISNVSWVLANITSESSHCFRKGNRNSGRRLCIMVCPSIWEDYYMLIYTHCWEPMNSVGSHGSSSLPFVMKVMVCHFVSNSHEVMTALIVVLPLIVVVEISLQLHRSCSLIRSHDELVVLRKSSNLSMAEL